MRTTGTDTAHIPEGADADVVPFLTLTAALVVATGSLYRQAGLLTTRLWAQLTHCDDPFRGDEFDLPTGPPSSQEFAAQWQDMLDCTAGLVPATYTRWSLIGLAVILLGTWLGYRLLPGIVVRTRSLRPLYPEHAPATFARLETLRRELGAEPAAGYWVSPNLTTIDGRVFGSNARPQLALSRALVLCVEHGRAQPQTTATLLHELAHLRRRDIGRTYLAVAGWWAFLVTAVAPFGVLTVVLAARGTDQQIRPLISSALLVLLVLLTRAAFLRSREFEADALAARARPDLFRVLLTGDDSLTGSTPTRTTRRLRQRQRPTVRTPSDSWSTPLSWFAWHPTAEQRRTAITDPRSRAHTSTALVAAIGIVLGAGTNDLIGLLHVAFWAPATLLSITAVIVAAYLLLAAAVVWTLLQIGHRAGSLMPTGAPAAPLVLPIAAIAAGLSAGELLSITMSMGGLWGAIGLSGTDLVTAHLLAVGFLVVALGGLCGWGAIGARIPGTSSPTRIFAASAAAAAALPGFLFWATLHWTPLMSRSSLQVIPAAADNLAEFSAPLRDWVTFGWFPLTGLLAMPGISSAAAAPILAWTWICLSPKAFRHRTDERAVGVLDRTVLRRAGGAAVAAVATAVTADAFLRWWLRPWYVEEHAGLAFPYLLNVNCWLLALIAIAAGTRAAARSPTVGLLHGSQVALATVLLATPALLATAAVTVRGVATLATGRFWELVPYLYGYLGETCIIATLFLGTPGFVIGWSRARQHNHHDHDHDHDGAEAHPAAGGRPVLVRTLAFTVLVLAAGQCRLWS